MAQIARADSIKAAQYSIKNLEVNTKYQDFGSTFIGTDKIVFSSSRRAAGVTKRVWKQNNQPFLDLYQGRVTKTGEILKVEPFSSQVNSKFHDAFVAFTPDGKEVYFTSNNYLDGKLKSSNIKIFRASVDEKGEWTNVVTLPFNSDDYDTGHPALSSDGKKLYFVSNMPGTLGDKDIFVVDVNNGHYGKPINLGPTINSKFKEFTPFLDGDVIYFSSNRGGGTGGFDIYMSKIDGSLSNAINLGKPMNSKADDFAFIIDSEKLKGYFSSNRPGGMGDDDIYSFVQTTANPICDQIITGIVKDTVSGLRVRSAFVALIDEGGNQLRKQETGVDGSFYFGVDCASKYTIEVTKEDYFGNVLDVNTSNKNGFDNHQIIFIEEKEFIVRRGLEMLNVGSIKFELNQHDILESSENTLERIVNLMSKYPEMVIEFGAHTDARAPDPYNLSLTIGRATETIDYLLAKGINPNRLVGKGYGETVIINKCVNNVKCTDLQHSMNKRTEFVVIKR